MDPEPRFPITRSHRVRIIALLVAVAGGSGTRASAHPLDVYVQAAEIDVARNVIVLRLRLTPGVYVAPQIIAGIDGNRDGVISDSERAAYAERICRDVSLTIDGRPEDLRLVASSAAAVDLMRQGLGDMVFTFQSDPPEGPGPHTLTFEDRHQASIAAYLVNALEPLDQSIRIVRQDRSYDQSRYRLEFDVGSAPASTSPETGSARGSLPGAGGWSVLATFVGRGVRHILTGYDHLLFLAALVLAAVTFWDLFKVVTAFTIAHSITLTLAALNLVHVPGRFVEPMIAGSIVFVALQNVFWPERARGLARLVVAFVFGLFHGLGFAGGLLDAMHQMPAATVLVAIVGFSLGVETGNQMVLVPLFGSMQFLRRARPQTSGLGSMGFQRIGSAVISAAGVYYLALALAAFA